MMRMNVISRVLVFGLLAVSPCVACAEAPIEVGQPVAIALEPLKFDLQGKRSRQQLLVTGRYSDENLRDLTPAAQFTSSNPAIVVIDGTVALPVANGEATITAAIGGQTVSIPVVVKNLEVPAPVSFKNETQMALTKAGCNMGACHGSPSGKGGFRLSLRAYDSALDIMTVRSSSSGDAQISWSLGKVCCCKSH